MGVVHFLLLAFFPISTTLHIPQSRGERQPNLVSASLAPLEAASAAAFLAPPPEVPFRLLARVPELLPDHWQAAAQEAIMARSSATGFTIISRFDGSVSVRKAFDYLKRFRAFVERTRNPFRGLVEATPDEIRFMGSTGQVWRIAWTNICKIAAFKRDLLSTDLICWEIELKEGFRRGWEEIKVIEIDEEMEGFQGVFEEAVRRNM